MDAQDLSKSSIVEINEEILKILIKECNNLEMKKLLSNYIESAINELGKS